jgi:sulfate permease, SulP family
MTAAFVAIAVLGLAPLARYVPRPALAALLLLTAARLIDFKRVSYTLRASQMDAGVVIVTALSALVFGLDAAILIGVALSILLFVPRAAKMRTAELFVDNDDVVRERLPSDRGDPGFLLYDLEGELFFGAGPELERTFVEIQRQAKASASRHILLRLKRVRNPDVVSLEHLEHFLKHAQSQGIVVWLAGLRPDLLAAFDRLRFWEWLPRDHVFPQGVDEDSATLAAIRRLRAELFDQRDASDRRLYYRM